MYLLGDSNAGQFIETAAAAANAEGYDFRAATPPGCPFLDVTRLDAAQQGPIYGQLCHELYRRSIEDLKNHPPALVILAASGTQYINSVEGFLDPATGARVTSPSRKAELWRTGLASTVHQLAGAGVPVVVVHTVPHQTEAFWDPSACPALRIYTATCPETSTSRPAIEAQQKLARQAEEQAIAGVEGVWSADFTDDLCFSNSCPSNRDGLLLYLDPRHLSVDGALTLQNRFQDLIRQHAG